MITVTTVPVGSTGILLEGVDVNGAVRESVVQADPEVADAFAVVVSSQPAAPVYGPALWVQGTPNVSVGALPGLNIVSSIPFYIAQSSNPWTVNGGVTVSSLPTVSSQIVSSIPILVAQSSAPWTVNGGVAVTSNVTVQGTSSVNVISSVPHAIVGTSQIFGTVSSQVISSIPFFVTQSSAPWTFNGGVQVTNVPTVNVTNVPAVNITTSIPFFVAQSSGPWSVVGTTSPNIVSSIPFFVAQSSAPWSFVETVSTAGGMSATTIALAATLNTTVVKGTAGQVYGILGANIGSSNVFVRIYNTSTAATTIASTGVPLVVWGMPISTSPYNNYDAGVPFSAGITILTQQQPYTASSSIAPTASTATITILFK